jgi:hypothetical protein
MRRKCLQCRNDVGTKSRIYCDYHAGYHAGYHAVDMKLKRQGSPEYREDERKKVQIRMRKLRAERRVT